MDARFVFEGTLPASLPPLPSSCPGCPAWAAVRGRGFPCASSCTSRSVSGGQEEDWGSQLFLGHISSVPEASGSAWGNHRHRHRCRPFPPSSAPCLPIPAVLQPHLSLLPCDLGPDVSPASPRPRASGEELPPPAPVPRPPSRPQSRPTGPAP